MPITVLGNLMTSRNADVQNIYSSIKPGLGGHLLRKAFLNPERKPGFLGTTICQYFKQLWEVDIMFWIWTDKETQAQIAEVTFPRAPRTESGKLNTYYKPQKS